MGEREAVQDAFALSGQTQQNLPGIVGTGFPRQQAQSLQTVYQPDGAVMLQQQAIRQMTYGWHTILRHPLQCQQSLMLLRLEPGITGSGFAEAEKAPNLKAELF